MADPGSKFFEQIGKKIGEGQQLSFDASKNSIRDRQDQYETDAKMKNEELAGRAQDLAMDIADHITEAREANEAAIKGFKEAVEEMITSGGIKDFTNIVEATNERAEEMNRILSSEIANVKSLIKDLSDDIGVGTDFDEVFDRK